MGVSNTGFIQVVREMLLTVSDITDIVENRVFSTHFIDYERATTQFPCIIIERIGGKAAYAESFQKVSFAVYCYSKVSTDEAMSIYDLVYSNINATRLYIDGLDTKGYCLETERPKDDYNMSCKGWYAKGRFLSYNAS
jgi:hypothetical protein